MSEHLNNLEAQEAAIDEKIVAANFEKMTTALHKFLTEESMGGNAGDVIIDGRRNPCLAANGYANKETGEIALFTNSPRPPADVSRGVELRDLSLRLACDVQRPGLGYLFRSVGSLDFTEFSEEGKRRLMKSVQKYNQTFDT